MTVVAGKRKDHHGVLEKKGENGEDPSGPFI